MTKSILAVAAVACAAIIPPAASATTFPALTTIYVGSGVLDDGGATDSGTATTFFCSNVSGQEANMRVLVLGASGSVVGVVAFTFQHGGTEVISTHGTIESELNLNTGVVRGVVNIESTQSGVFCRGAVVNAAGPREDSSPIALVRVNAHPGTVE